MAHPRRYDDDDPYPSELRGVCLSLPESVEVGAWGRPTFRAGKKMFAVFEGNLDHPFAVVFKPDPPSEPRSPGRQLFDEGRGNAVSTKRRVHAIPAVLLLVALASLACDARPQNPQPAAQEARGDAQPGADPEDPGAATPEARGRSFALPAGNVTIRRAGFATLRIVDVGLKPGWRRQIEDDFDESVGIEFFRGRRSLDFDASLENGRLSAETCREISRLSTRPAIEGAATVALQRIGDDDLHVRVVRTSPGWQARIVDNNSDDVEVLVRSGQERLELDAQLDDGRLEGNICRTLA